MRIQQIVVTLVFILFGMPHIFAGNIPCASTLLQLQDDFSIYTTEGLTDSGVENPSCGDYTDNDIWFSVVCPPSGRLTIATVIGSMNDAAMAVYSGSCLDPEEILCVENDLCGNTEMPIQDMHDLTPGQVYYIRIWHHNGASPGTFGIRVSDGPPPIVFFELVGTANYITQDGEDCIRLTTESTGQTGCAWLPEQQDFNLFIDYQMEISLGDMDAGADGICMVFQRDPAGLNACGTSGGQIAAGGIQNSFIIEFDTWFNPEFADNPPDHIAVNINGDMANPIAGPVNLPNIEDGQVHIVRFTWNPNTMFYQVFFDGTEYINGTYDIINNCFGGNNLAYYGFTASTGGAVNEQIICPHQYYPSGNEREEEVEICEDEFYFAGGANQNTSGTYTDIYQTLSGCDSIVHTILTVFENANSTLDATICDDECFEINNQVFCSEGSYDVVFENATVNGCDSIVELNLTILSPYAAVYNPDELNCAVEEVLLDASLSPSGQTISYIWSGPNGFSSSEQSPWVSEPGTYTLIVAETQNGVTCLSLPFDVFVIQDIEEPIADAGEDQTISCGEISAVLDGSNSSQGDDFSYEWNGPNGYNSNELSPTVFSEGVYILTVQNSDNFCESSDTVEVDQDNMIPDLSITGDTLRCGIDSLQILVDYNGNPDFVWSGPNGFSSNEAEPYINTAGYYYLSTTFPNGCMRNDSVEIIADDMIPNVELSADTLDCLVLETIIMSTTNDDIDSYSWTGPNGFTSDESDPTVMDPGLYTLMVESNNGCSNTVSIEIILDDNIIEIEAIGDTLFCQSDSVQIIGNFDNSLEFEWKGPNGFSSQQQNPFVFINGSYILEVINENGCISKDTAQVIADQDAPQIEIQGDSITCDDLDLDISVTIDNTNATVVWTGPNGFMSNELSPDITEVGTYEVIVTAPNGCQTSGTTEVVSDTISPDLILNAGTINCVNTSSTINVVTNTNISTYDWSGPNGYISNEAEPMVTMNGIYTLTATAENGCSKTINTTVPIDTITPQFDLLGGEISCNVPQVNINIETLEILNNYQWSGPNNYSSTTSSIEIDVPGNYTLSATGLNGCENSESIEITADTVKPSISLDANNLNCFDPISSVLNNLHQNTYENIWSGPNNYSSTNIEAEASSPGIYYLTVSSSNGCVNTDSIEILADFETPDVSISGSDLLTCIDPESILSITSNLNLIDFNWELNNNSIGSNSTLTISQGGTVYFTGQSENGCLGSDSITITSTINEPSLDLTGDILNCNSPEITISSSTNASNVSYNWVGPNNYNSNDQNIMINDPGTYYLEIQDLNSFCRASDSIEIIADFEPAQYVVTFDSINCNQSFANVMIQNISSNVSYLWSGPNNFDSNDTQFQTSDLGTYYLEATNNDNGCKILDSIEIIEILGPEQVVLDVIQANCTEATGSISVFEVIGGTAPYEYAFNGSNQFTNSPDFGSVSPGDYTIQVRDAAGCIIEGIAIIDEIIPIEIDLIDNLSLEYNAQYTLSPELNIDASDILNIVWTPADNLSCSNCLNPILTAITDEVINLTIQDKNGCEDMVSVRISLIDPEFYIPNAFSPNRDGQNDRFTIYGDATKFDGIESLLIYDRWGNKIFENTDFEINDEDEGWDGKFLGKKLDPAVFSYVATIKITDNRIRITSGTVTIVE